MRLNDDTTGMPSGQAASWPTRLALNRLVWTTAGRRFRRRRPSRPAAGNQVRPALRASKPSATTSTPASSNRGRSASRPYSLTTVWSIPPRAASASTSSTSRFSAPPDAARESMTWITSTSPTPCRVAQASMASRAASWVATLVRPWTRPGTTATDTCGPARSITWARSKSS